MKASKLSKQAAESALQGLYAPGGSSNLQANSGSSRANGNVGRSLLAPGKACPAKGGNSNETMMSTNSVDVVTRQNDELREDRIVDMAVRNKVTASRATGDAFLLDRKGKPVKDKGISMLDQEEADKATEARY